VGELLFARLDGELCVPRRRVEMMCAERELDLLVRDLLGLQRAFC
jgi:hypothetical protein